MISAELDVAIMMCLTAGTGDPMVAFGRSGDELGKVMREVETTLRFTTGS
jgi:hypothetical protein